jgi:protein TonB
MFTAVVSPDARSTRKWYTVPLSFLIHTVIIAVLIAVPLIATDVLPATPRTMLQYMKADVPPTMPPIAPIARVPPSATPAINPDAAPLLAPNGVSVESGVVVDPQIASGTVDDLVVGFGGTSSIIEHAPAPTAPPLEWVRPGGVIKPPARIRDAQPVYPSIAKLAKVQGVVIIEAIIGVDGNVEDARVIRSIPLLDDAALEAVRSWAYTPTLLNGRPTPVIMTVTVRFKLE